MNLYVTPSSAQVLVDGFYVGTVADYQDRSLWLESGPRRIELRADGYEPAAFDVQVIEDRIVDYRRDLVRDARVAVPAEAAATSRDTEDLLRDTGMLCRRHATCRQSSPRRLLDARSQDRATGGEPFYVAGGSTERDPPEVRVALERFYRG